jgi:HPt (histidine-containing phosphotransfer) domain-containing protein
MSDFLAKPLRKPTLVAAVLRAIGSVPIRAAGSPAQPPTSAPLDRTTLVHLTAAIGEDGVRQTFAMFSRETESRLAMFRQFTEGNDRNAIAIEAHALKGSARTLGATVISEIAGLIEGRAAGISSDELRDAVERLDAAYRQMRREFEADLVQVA